LALVEQQDARLQPAEQVDPAAVAAGRGPVVDLGVVDPAEAVVGDPDSEAVAAAVRAGPSATASPLTLMLAMSSTRSIWEIRSET
jgi:hypothetical protein